MSLKFGIYLVEQRIISPEQFCGLVKIQQEASMSLATIAIRQNYMTMKQVSRVLDILEKAPEQSFVQAAMNEELIDQADADRMIHLQQMSCPSIKRLLVECGLLTQRQAEVLNHHFERRPIVAAQPAGQPQPSTPVTPTPQKPQAPAPAAPTRKQSPRQPKFTQRPIVTQPYVNQPQ